MLSITAALLLEAGSREEIKAKIGSKSISSGLGWDSVASNKSPEANSMDCSLQMHQPQTQGKPMD